MLKPHQQHPELGPEESRESENAEFGTITGHRLTGYSFLHCSPTAHLGMASPIGIVGIFWLFCCAGFNWFYVWDWEYKRSAVTVICCYSSFGKSTDL